jgi:hypothetical protein
MIMTKFTAIDPAGLTHIRNSKDRTYTHTVVALPSSVRYTLSAMSPEMRKAHRHNFKYHAAFADGTSQWLERKVWETEVQHLTRTQQEIARSKSALQGCETAQEYENMMVDAALARIKKAMTDGFYATYQNLGWCGRHDLAQKLKIASENKGWVNVTILEAK